MKPSNMAHTRRPRCARSMRHCQKATSVTTRAAINTGRNACMNQRCADSTENAMTVRPVTLTGTLSWRSAQGVGRTPRSRRLIVSALECSAERFFRLVANAACDRRHGEIGGREHFFGEVHPPVREIADGRSAQHFADIASPTRIVTRPPPAPTPIRSNAVLDASAATTEPVAAPCRSVLPPTLLRLLALKRDAGGEPRSAASRAVGTSQRLVHQRRSRHGRAHTRHSLEPSQLPVLPVDARRRPVGIREGADRTTDPASGGSHTPHRCVRRLHHVGLPASAAMAAFAEWPTWRRAQRPGRRPYGADPRTAAR